MRRSLYLSLLVGCSFDHGIPVGMNPGVDGAMPSDDGSMVVTGDAQQCWSIAKVSLDFCLTTPPSGTLSIDNDATVDTNMTGTGPLECKALVTGSSNVCVIAATQIAIAVGATLSATGDRPLVLLATTITVDGEIDVASHANGVRGPGANAPGCTSGDSASSAGGGQGGSFGGAGGDGGDGTKDNSGGSAGNPLATVSSLRGGCPGGAGHGGTVAGDGGGAVALIADTLAFGVAGRVNASGAGGRGAGSGPEGGGGGGSGGMIVLSAGSITVQPTTQLFANGGHGGGGSDDEERGDDGGDPTTATSGGTGGNGAEGAGDGGTGYPSAMRGGQDSGGWGGGPGSGDEAGGGGGGGGGCGVIEVDSTSSIADARVSPPPS